MPSLLYIDNHKILLVYLDLSIIQAVVPVAVFKKQSLLSRQRRKIDPDAEEKIVLISNRDLLY